jgi:hypothetical protein
MTAIALVVVAGCGAAPNQPVLANAPRPNPAAVAGVAAGAAAALTLADPDAATRGPEKKQDVPKKEIQVKENVPADVLDRMDANAATKASADATDQTGATNAAVKTTTKRTNKKAPKITTKLQAEPDGAAKPNAEPAGAKTKAAAPKDALDFGAP